MAATKEHEESNDIATCGICSEDFPLMELFGHLDACKKAKFSRMLERYLLSSAIGRIFSPPTFWNAGDGNEIIPGLMLGGAAACRSPAFISRHEVKAILNCAAEVRALPEKQRLELGVFWYQHLCMDDVSHVNFEPEIVHGIEKLAQAMILVESGGGNVLVHCAAGVSRSATIVMGYLMLHRDMTLEQAALLVKEKRPIVYPNPGFWRVLQRLEDRKFETISVPAAALRLHDEHLLAVPEAMPLSADEEEQWRDWLATRDSAPDVSHTSAI